MGTIFLGIPSCSSKSEPISESKSSIKSSGKMVFLFPSLVDSVDSVVGVDSVENKSLKLSWFFFRRTIKGVCWFSFWWRSGLSTTSGSTPSGSTAGG